MSSDHAREDRARGPADWLGLAGAPVFAGMALVTALNGGADMICSTTTAILPFDGMVTMYLLMTAFHLGPWLRLLGKA